MTDERTSTRPPPENLKAALWILAASVIAATLGAVVKIAGQRIGALEVTFVRAAIGFLLVLPFLMRKGRASFHSGYLLLQGVRGVSASLSMLFGFYALVHLPLADAVAINFSKALFIPVLAFFLLGERLHMRRSLATVAGFVGVLVMMRPSGHFESASLVALASAALVACNIVMVKLLSDRDGTETMILYSNLFQVLFLGLPALYFWQPPGAAEWLLLLAIGVFGTLIQLCVVRAYTLGEATAIVPVDYSRILFAAIVGYYAFDDVPDIWTWAGAAIVIGSTLYITRREARLGRTTSARASLDRAV